jgi:hypothetical protein
VTECRTVSVSIKRHPDQVYEYLADPANFPRWSLFIREIRKERDQWIAQTPNGAVRIRFTPRNDFRVLDHDVTVSPALKIHVPMRVLPNSDDGSEVTFSVFRLPGMSARQFEDDIKMVLSDLASLKRYLEGESNS